MEKRKKMHYAWKVVIACIAIKVGSAGVTMACMGNFVTPIVKELGCQVSEFTMFTSIEAISMALLYTFAAKMLTTKKIGLVVGIASVAEVTGVLMMSSYHSVYLFYQSGAIIGIAQAFTGFVAIPIIINMWFKKNAGTVLGVVVAVGSAAIVFYSLLSAQLITAFGWRQAYLIMGIMAAVLTIPAVFFLLKSPEEAGCMPYGADEEPVHREERNSVSDGSSLTKKQAFAMPLLYIAWLACVFYSYGSGVQSYTTTFFTMELGQSINAGSVVGVCASLGGILSSLIIGKINDKHGVKAGLLWGAVTTAAGYLLIFMGYANPMFVFPSVFIVGLGSMMYTVQCPLLARKVVGDEHYAEIWARMMMINSLIGGGLYSSIGLFYDKLGTYQGAFVMAIVLYAAAWVLGSIAINSRDRQLREERKDRKLNL